MLKTIEVTQEDINKGQQSSCAKCPIALALARAFPGRETLAGVFYLFIYNLKGETIFQAITPQEVVHFMNSFDVGKEVVPFSFTVDFAIEE